VFIIDAASCSREVYVLRKSIILLAVLLVVAGMKLPAVHALLAQQSQMRQPPLNPGPMEREMAERRAREANKQRQEEIRSDTQKLFQLATELKDAVDKTNENMLSLDVVKKADEVEKLAKKVKEKMKEGTATPPPPVKEPPRWGIPPPQ
jgi:hypothetical protein